MLLKWEHELLNNDVPERKLDMKNKLAALLAMMAVLVICCSSAMAATADFYTYLDRITDPDDPIKYEFYTTETGVMIPDENYDPSSFISVLREVTLIPVDLDETPEGEYVVLYFPDDDVRFDFFLREKPDKDYIRQTNPDGSEELFRARMPEDVFISLDELITTEAQFLAENANIQTENELVIPEEGWVRIGLDGAVWEDEPAKLTIRLVYDFYVVNIVWANSQEEWRVWTIYCDYDPEDDVLVAFYSGCECVENNGTATLLYGGSSETVIYGYDNGEVIIINDPEDGLLDEKVLVLTDEKWK